jgi:hypothetical protein
MTPQQFVTKWSKIQQKETAVSQSHFWFSSMSRFSDAHQPAVDEQLIAHLLDEDL